MMRNILILLVIFTLTTIISGCTKKEQPMDLYDVIKKRGKVVIGVRSSVQPFNFLDENQNYTGFEIDLAKEIAKKILNDETLIEFLPVETSGKIMTLNSGRADMIIALMTITPQRNTVIDFSNPYYVAGQSIMVLKDSDVRSLTDLQSKRIGVIFGTTAEKEISSISPMSLVAGFKTYNEAIEALKAKKIDAIATDDTLLRGFAMEDSSLKVLKQQYTKEPYGIALRKGTESTRVLEIINEIIESINNDKSSTSLRKKWNL